MGLAKEISWSFVVNGAIASPPPLFATSPRVRDILTRILRSEGFSVQAVEDSSKGLEALRDGHFDLVLLDLMLPRKSGLEVVKEIRAIDANVEIVMLTAFSSVETAVEATKSGVFDYLVKRDEVGSLSREMQAKLLRAIQSRRIRPAGSVESKPVDVRILSATNKDLRLATERGEFRGDLFYQLNVMNICLPPLREHREDIPLLVKHFLNRTAAADGKPLKPAFTI